MRKIIFILLASINTMLSFAQIESVDGGMSAYRKIELENYGDASHLAFYKVQYLKDSTQTNKYSEAQCVLQISNDYLCFSDYYQLIVDSIETCFVKERKTRTKENLKKWENAASLTMFHTKIVTSLKSNTIKAQIYTGLNDYEYTDTLPDINWTLLQGDTIINGVVCKKALCNYAGRKYVAWYAESIPMPYGPYIFHGLPGLIMETKDTKNNWIFTNNGVCKAGKGTMIYLYKKGFISGNVIKTTRRKALEALQNEIENSANLFIEKAKVEVLSNGKWTTPESDKPRQPSNLIEQKW